MRALAAVVLILTLTVGLTLSVQAGPGGGGPGGKAMPGKPLKVKIHNKGQAFCPTSALIVGNVVISSGRCYVVYALRDGRGTFLAFADPAFRIPPGQIVRLSTPAGAKLKGRIFYLVPIQPSVVIVPMNSITLVSFRTEDFGPRLTMTIVGVPAPNLFVVFQVRL